MKKTLTSLFAILLVLTALLGLSSCGAVEFKVNFVVDGEVYATVNTNGNETIKVPDNPIKEGDTFDGWYWDKDTWEEPFTANSLLDAPLSSDMNVYAKWKSNEPIHTHTSSDWIEDKAATCKEAGSKHKECTECKEVLESATIGKTENHTPVTDAGVLPTTSSEGLTEGSHCSVCGIVITAQSVIPKTTLTATNLTAESKNLSGKFSYATEVYNFAENISVTNNASWVVSVDAYGVNTVTTKTSPLNEGNNTFYIHISNPDSTVYTYTVNIYRNHLYTVAFNTDGGTSVGTQYIEEGYLAEKPTTSRVGYTFNSWSYDFDVPVTSNITVNASWNANPNTTYKVEYYLENEDKTGYANPIVENLTGTTDTRAYAEQKTFDHFTLNYFMSQLGGNIDGDGSRVLRMYYTRNTYSVRSSDTSMGSVTNFGNYTYREGFGLTLKETHNLGYNFIGWYSGNQLLSTDSEYNATIDRNIEARFDIAPEMQNFYFTSGETTCTITGVKDIRVTEIIVPEIVTSIKNGAFSYCSSLESITLPFVNDSFIHLFGEDIYGNDCTPSSLKSVTILGGNIPSQTFTSSYCQFESLTLGETVTNIETPLFYWNDSVNNITVSEKNTAYKSIDGNLYTKDGKTLIQYATGKTETTFDIPEGVRMIGNSAFTCSSLTSVTIPDSVTSIGGTAFYGARLTSVVIPDSVESVGYWAFSALNENTIIYCETESQPAEWDSEWKSSDYPVVWNCKNNKVADDGNIYTTIDEIRYALKDGIATVIEQSYNITVANIPSSVTFLGVTYTITSISEEAFYSCPNLTSVTIPNSVTSVGYNAFSTCPVLTIYCEAKSEPNGWSYDWNGASYPVVWNCNNNEVADDGYIYAIIDGLRYRLKDGVATIITQPKSITIANIPASVTHSGVSYSVTSIGSSAFGNCTSLTSITIPDTIKSIDYWAFYGCTGLTSITIGNGVESIGSSAFERCTNLTSIIVSPENTKYHSAGNCLIETSSRTLILGCKNSDIPRDGSVTSIGTSAFYNCTRLTSITIPDSVTRIGDSAFYGCTNLASIEYRGTWSQWDAISMGYNWDYNTGDYTITYNYTGE